MKISYKGFALAIVLGMVSGSSAADVNDKMSEMFGSSSNITRPGVANSATRGVVTGGSVVIRNPIVQPSGFAFEPPSISAGCGGIDMYGGNLSFPSKEQYIATARAVVGNIGGYAFKQALKTVCDSCESIMTAIQDTVNMLNIDNMNSCQIAKGVVDGFKDGSLDDSIANRGRNVAASWKEAAGSSRDWFESFNSGKGESPTKEAVADEGMKSLLQGNWTWDSLEKTEAFDWLGSDRRTREQIMSLLGTVITCVPGENGCEGEGKDPVPKMLEPKLRLQDFVALASQSSREYQYYTCQDDDCLNPNLKASHSLGTTASQKIVDGLLGSDGKDGILKRLIKPGNEVEGLSANERALIENTGDITANAVACMRAGDQGQGYARMIVEGMAPVIAADALYRAADQSITYLIADLSNRQQAIGTGLAVEMLKNSRNELARQNRDIQEATRKSDMLATAINRCAASPLARAMYGAQR